MWTEENRKLYDRKGLRYPSDMTDEEWALVKPLIPPGKRHGRHRTVDLREVLNGIFYVLSTGCQWRALPKDLPPRSTVNEYFKLWEWDGTLERIHHALFVQVRELAGKEAGPTAAIIDSQSVKAAERGGATVDPVGYDAGKCPQGTRSGKIKGIKRHVTVDTLGMVLVAEIQPANVQDRDGALPVLADAGFPSSRRSLPMAAIKDNPRLSLSPLSAIGIWKSSNEPIRPRASPCCPSVGSWSVPSPGSDAAGACPSMSKI